MTEPEFASGKVSMPFTPDAIEYVRNAIETLEEAVLTLDEGRKFRGILTGAEITVSFRGFEVFDGDAADTEA